ncbi:MAG: molybdopterin molybdotransferase MoeA [Deltaproteobacteria bacterium]|nr:molybdopterin molybdotransferase MoeA [Deltaproteobacteria bacterium]
MIQFEEALEIVLGSARFLGSEPVDLVDSLGRILAEDIVSDIDMPPFDKSSMDGYACKLADIRNPLKILEILPAGKKPEKTIGKNQCSKIMTGAAVPEGADCVIMVEHTRLNESGEVLFTADKTDKHIYYKGEDIKGGEIVLEQFRRIRPQHVAILASAGKARPLVSKRPKVGIIATGDELVEPSQALAPFSIRNSNSYQLFTQILAADAIPAYYGIAKDTENDIDRKLRQALRENDVVLLSGGVSMGDFDLTPSIMERNGIDIKFKSIAVKPGKPTHFGLSNKAYCFGLPGNPVSTFVQFESLIKPFLYKLMGYEYDYVYSKAKLESDVLIKPHDRESWIPVSLTDDNRAIPLRYHGSAHINALRWADGFILIPIGSPGIEKEATVKVRRI